MAPITVVVFGVAVSAIPVVKDAVMVSMKIAATAMVVVMVAKGVTVEVEVGTG